MTTPLPDIRDRIVAVVIATSPAVVPEGATALAFKHWTRPGLPEDGSGHLHFVVRWIEGGEDVAFGTDVSEQSHALELRVTYSPVGIRTEELQFDALTQDGSALRLAIDRAVGWPAGTLKVATGRARREERNDRPEIDLVIPIDLEIEEN